MFRRLVIVIRFPKQCSVDDESIYAVSSSLFDVRSYGMRGQPLMCHHRHHTDSYRHTDEVIQIPFWVNYHWPFIGREISDFCCCVVPNQLPPGNQKASDVRI